MEYLVFVTTYASSLATRLQLPSISVQPPMLNIFITVNTSTTYAGVAGWLVSRWTAMPSAVRVTFNVDSNHYLAVHWRSFIPANELVEADTLETVWGDRRKRNTLLQRVGLLEVQWKYSGPFQPAREPTDEERFMWQGLVDRMRERFIEP